MRTKFNYYSDIKNSLHVPEDAFPSFHNTKFNDQDIVLTLEDNGETLGFAKITPNKYAPAGKPELFINFIEVAHSARNKGLAGAMLNSVFEYAQNHPDGSASLLIDGFTQDGKKYLMKQMNELSRTTGVPVIFVPGC